MYINHQVKRDILNNSRRNQMLVGSRTVFHFMMKWFLMSQSVIEDIFYCHEPGFCLGMADKADTQGPAKDLSNCPLI